MKKEEEGKNGALNDMGHIYDQKKIYADALIISNIISYLGKPIINKAAESNKANNVLEVKDYELAMVKAYIHQTDNVYQLKVVVFFRHHMLESYFTHILIDKEGHLFTKTFNDIIQVEEYYKNNKNEIMVGYELREAELLTVATIFDNYKPTEGFESTLLEHNHSSVTITSKDKDSFEVLVTKSDGTNYIVRTKYKGGKRFEVHADEKYRDEAIDAVLYTLKYNKPIFIIKGPEIVFVAKKN